MKKSRKLSRKSTSRKVSRNSQSRKVQKRSNRRFNLLDPNVTRVKALNEFVNTVNEGFKSLKTSLNAAVTEEAERIIESSPPPNKEKTD